MRHVGQLFYVGLSLSLLPFVVGIAQAVPLRIAVTVPYLKDIVAQVTCFDQHDSVVSLLAPDADVHHFAMTPKDRVFVHQAHVVIKIGGGLEPWLDKVPLKSTQKILVVKDILALPTTPAGVGAQTWDPHVWQSPALTRQTVAAVSKILVEADPSRSAVLKSCTKDYLERLEKSVAALKKQALLVPAERRILVTNHNSFAYFADTFGFQTRTLLGTSDVEEPSLQQIQDLVLFLKRNPAIPAVFFDAYNDNKNMMTVAKEVHAKIGGKLYADSLGKSGSGAETTLGMWQTNMETIIRSLK